MRYIAMISFVLATAVASHAFADEELKRSPELQVLNRFVGAWDFDVTLTPAQGAVTTEKTSEIRKWSLGGNFIHFQNPHTGRDNAPEFHMLVTYDARTKSYPGVLTTGADRSLVNGTWDEQDKTMTFTGTLSGGGSFDFKNQFLDNGNIKTSGVIKDASGKVVLKRSDMQVRRKK